MPIPKPANDLWTIDDLEALDWEDGKRFEILHGRLLMTRRPSLRHQLAMTGLIGVLSQATSSGPPAEPLHIALVPMGRTSALVADVVVYPGHHPRASTWFDLPVPLLVIEITSIATRRRDRHWKRPEYLRHGVQEVWTVDPDRREIERWTPASEFPTTERHDFDFQLTPAHPSVRITLQTVFGTPAA